MDVMNVSFGAPAAERDIDQGLERYFVESQAYKRVSDGVKKIVLGNRGTGKSAIFKVLAERERKQGAQVIELAPEDYSYEMLSSVLRSESEGSWAKHGAYAAAWKYLVLVLVLKALNASGAGTGRKKKAGGIVNKFLRDNFAGEQASKLDALISYLKRMEGIKIGPVEASIRTRELQQLYKLGEFDPILPSMIDLLEGQRVIVLVDELDRGWDASEDAQAFVAGLFQACARLNGVSDNLRIYLSLRQELYDSIPALYDDAQKFRDLIETIEWDEATLLQLMANRIAFSLPELDSESDEARWSEIFAEILDYRRNRSFNYMIDRTLYRPRELIEFASRATEVAQDRGAEAFPIDYSVITEAENRYSEERAKDIAAEYRFQYPGLLSVFEVFRGKTYTIERPELEDICLELATGEASTDPEATEWVLDANPEGLIDVLWGVGFLRAQAVGGIKARRRSGSQYLGPYQVANLSLHNLTRFQVHPMFRSYLGSKEPKAALP
jgi:hypothetical protein